MPGQATNGGDAGHTHERATATLAHGRHEGLEGGGEARDVGGQHLGQHVDVGAHRRVDAYADAGAGDHHIGQAHGVDASLAGADDAVDVLHIGGEHGPALGCQAFALRPGLHLGRAPRHQRQAPAFLCIARRQRLADAA